MVLKVKIENTYKSRIVNEVIVSRRRNTLAKERTGCLPRQKSRKISFSRFFRGFFRGFENQGCLHKLCGPDWER